MKINFIFIFFACILRLNAQREADCLAVGYCDYSLPQGCNIPYGSSIYKFNIDSLESINENAGLNLSTSYSRAAFSDNTTGDLLFASNGWRLVNSQGNILAHKLWRADIPWPNDNYDSTMVLNSLGPLFLNDPGDSTKAYLFYGQYKIMDLGTGVRKYDVLFTYAYLDIPTQSLISKNNVLLDELTAPGDMQACRHANGRDWWVIKPGRYEDEYYIGILSPSGLLLEKITIPEATHREQGETFTYFNQEGNRLIHFTGKENKYLYGYDFDRCRGSLSNMEFHDLSDSLQPGDWTACTISPDGSKLYIRRSSVPGPSLEGGGTLQYDLETGAFQHFTEIGNVQLTPNYKNILMGSRIIVDAASDSSIQTLSTIFNPNAPYPDFQFVENSDTVINITGFISPSNFANFRLGKLLGSPCDTIVSGVQVILPKGLQFGVFPNPSNGVFSISLPKNQQLRWELSNTLGQKVCSGAITAAEASYNIPNVVTNGLYVLSLVNEYGEIVGVKKLIINKE